MRARIRRNEHVHLSHTDHAIGASRRMPQTLQITVTKTLQYLLDVLVPTRSRILGMGAWR